MHILIMFSHNITDMFIYNLIGTVTSEGSYLNRSYTYHRYYNNIVNSSLKKNFSFLLCFTPLKLNFFFSSILNFPSKMRLAGVCFSCAACLCGIENYSHIRTKWMLTSPNLGEVSIHFVKIEL